MELTDDLVDALLAGEAGAAAAAPPELVSALGALRAPADVSELAGERAARRVFALAQYALGPAAARRVRPVRRVATTIAITAAVITATSGLAAARVLPEPVQDIADRALSAIGVHVPDAADLQLTAPVSLPRAPHAALPAPPELGPPPPTQATEPSAPAPQVSPPPPPAAPTTTTTTTAGQPPEPAAPTESAPPPPTTPTTAPADKGIGNGGVPGSGGVNPNASGNNRGGNGSGDSSGEGNAKSQGQSR